jgi:hypothetical protein
VNRSRRLEQLAVTIHDRLSSSASIDPADLVVAGMVLLGPDHPHVLSLVETFGLDAAKTRVLFNHPSGRREILISASKVDVIHHPEPLHDRVKVEDLELVDGMVPPGVYTVGVTFRGLDNVVVEVDKPTSLDDMEAKAKSLWGNDELANMGNEWQEAQSYTVQPVDEEYEAESGSYDTVGECIDSGDHLKSCDNDGYCNYCGSQESVAEFNAGHHRTTD